MIQIRSKSYGGPSRKIWAVPPLPTQNRGLQRTDGRRVNIKREDGPIHDPRDYDPVTGRHMNDDEFNG